MSSTILITGANGHLGNAVVDHLLADSFTIEAALGPWGNINTNRPGLHCEMVDLLDEEAANDYIEAVLDRRKGIHAAVLIAGGFSMAPLAETSTEDLDRMIDLNFRTAFHLVKPLMRHFEAKEGGRFIFISARPAFHPKGGVGAFAYTLSKGMVRQMAELINAEPTEKNIRAALIAPSIIDTPNNRKAMPNAKFDEWVPASKIAEGISFLLSDAGKMLQYPVLELYNQA